MVPKIFKKIQKIKRIKKIKKTILLKPPQPLCPILAGARAAGGSGKPEADRSQSTNQRKSDSLKDNYERKTVQKHP